MLTRFVLDPEGVGMEGCDPALQTNLTRGLLNVWLKCGILYVGTGDYKNSQLCRELNLLPPKLRAIWLTAIVFAQRHCLLQTGPPTWSGCFPKGSPECFAALVPIIEMAGISKGMADRLGFASDEPARIDTATNLEVCRMDCLTAASVFQRAEHIRETKKYKRGDSVDGIWNDLFKGFVAHFSQMAAIDRFCVQRLADPYFAHGESGVEQFLRRVDDCQSTAPGSVVQIISSLARGQSRAEVVARLTEFSASLPNRRIASLVLNLVHEKEFKKIVHYRCVRFQSHHTLMLDHGIEILEGRTVKRTHPCSFTCFDETFRRDENEILENSERVKVYERLTAPKPTRPPTGARASLGPGVLPPRPGLPATAMTR